MCLLLSVFASLPDTSPSSWTFSMTARRRPRRRSVAREVASAPAPIWAHSETAPFSPCQTSSMQTLTVDWCIPLVRQLFNSTVDQAWKTFWLDSWASLCQAMLDLLLVIFMCIWLYLRILFKYRPNIKYKYMPFCDFQFNYKYTKFQYSNTITNTPNFCIQIQLQIHQISAFKYNYKYVFESNPAWNTKALFNWYCHPILAHLHWVLWHHRWPLSGLGYHRDQQSRAAFMEVLTKILQQGTEFETLAETALADRFERLVELVTMIGDKGELPIAMALASVVATPHMVC